MSLSEHMNHERIASIANEVFYLGAAIATGVLIETILVAAGVLDHYALAALLAAFARLLVGVATAGVVLW